MSDDLDGCLADVPVIEEDQTADDALDGVVLFADVDPDDAAAVAARRAEWRRLFGGET